MPAATDRAEARLYADEKIYAGPVPPHRRPVPGHLHCPVCNESAAFFLPFGRNGRRNARCPTCGSVERMRFAWLYLAYATPLFRQRLSVLHTAPERCFREQLSALRTLDYLTVDKFDPSADLHADLTDLPLASESRDVVLSSHVLEHIPDDAAAIAELYRVLKPGGWAVILVPFDPKRPATEEGRHVADPAERLARFGHPFHYRNPGLDWPDRLTAAGFHVARVDSKRWLTPHKRRFWRINRNYLFLCRKA